MISHEVSCALVYGVFGRYCLLGFWITDRPWLHCGLFVLDGHVAETVMCCEEKFEALVNVS